MPTTKRSRTQSEQIVDRRAVARIIAGIIDDRQLTQTEAAYMVKDAPSQISLVVNGRVDGFSIERLVRMLTRLGSDVELRIRKSPRARGKVKIVRA
jgi:predicted XRE-type DNA-binding protein